MSDDLFYAGKRKRTSGGFSVSCSGGAEFVKRLHKLENGGKEAIQRTVSDFTSRAPAWVSQGIREHYGVDTAAIKDAAQRPRRRTTIKVAGVSVDGASLVYKGRTLTPVHFKMSPKQRPEGRQKNLARIPGQGIGDGSPVAMVAPPKKYKVKATIIKGNRVTLPAGSFLTTAHNATIPFQRTGEGRYPIEAIRTLSVPQMIDGRAHDTIEETVSTKLGERFEHHIKRAMK